MSPRPTSPVAFGPYRILRKIARGGSTEVMLAAATEGQNQQVLVLKRLLPEWSAVDEVAKTFLREANVAKGLHHPSIGRILDVGRIDGQCYFAVEYLAGEDLASVIQQARRAGQLPPLDVAAEALCATCEALHAAHTARPNPVFHKDLSPSNVVVTYEGSIKVIDFGITPAEFARGSGPARGKIQYMSPEHASGAPADARSDVFAAGIVLHEMITTHRLFRRGNESDTLHALLQEPIPPPSALRVGVPAELDRICLTALDRSPARRFPTAAAFAEALTRFLGGQREKSRKGLSAFLEQVFPADRRQKKLRAALGNIPEAEPAELTPLRTDPRIATSATMSLRKPAASARRQVAWVLAAAVALLLGGFGLGTAYRGGGCAGSVNR